MNKGFIEIGKSVIAVGQMFIQFPKPIGENQPLPQPRVWVKVGNEVLRGEEVSLFVDNNAIVRLSVKAADRIGIMDKWYISDGYYGKSVREGDFVPIDDLRETDGICEEMGYPPYRVDLGF